MNFIITCLFRVYRIGLSPLLQAATAAVGVVSPIGRQCRFEVSCSDYAEQQIRRAGWLKGGWLALLRLSRCHPWNERAL